MQNVSRTNHKFSDLIVMVERSMRHSFRSSDTVITTIALPIMIMAMFVYVFGGSIDTGAVDYINYVVPGIVLMCIAFGATYTAVRLNNDMTKGIIDRFRSMPISQSSILGGHVLTSVVFNSFSTVLVIFFAVLMGFRADAGIIEWLLVVGMLLLFMLAMTWMSVTFGLMANSAEGAGAYSYPVLGLLFVSSAFVPTDSMPEPLRLFAQYQPMTPMIETVRSLMMSEPVGTNALVAILWWSGILLVSYMATMRIYNRKTA